MCKVFAQAIAQIPVLPGRLCFSKRAPALHQEGPSSDSSSVRWDSKLLLSLSPKVVDVMLIQSDLPVQGEDPAAGLMTHNMHAPEELMLSTASAHALCSALSAPKTTHASTSRCCLGIV